MDVRLMSKERSVPAGLNFEKQVFRIKCGTPLSMTYLLQTRKKQPTSFQIQIDKLDSV